MQYGPNFSSQARKHGSDSTERRGMTECNKQEAPGINYQQKPHSRTVSSSRTHPVGILAPKNKSYPFVVGLPLFWLRKINRTIFMNSGGKILPLV